MSESHDAVGDGNSPSETAEPDSVATYRADLTLDEFRTLVECVPDLLLPPLLKIGSLEESATDGSPNVEERRAAATEGLKAKRHISVFVGALPGVEKAFHSDPAGLHPLLRAALTVPLVAESSIMVQSWTPKSSSRTLVAVGKSVASTYTVTVDRPPGEESPEPGTQLTGLVSIQVGPFSSIAEALIALLDDAHPEPENVRPISLRVGLVEARSLIEAIRQGNDMVVHQLAEQLGASSAMGVLRSLAATMDAGFRMQVYVRPNRLIHTSDWVQSTKNEWVTMRLLVPGLSGELTPELLTDEGQVDMIRGDRSMITAEIMSVVTTLVELAVNVAAARKAVKHG